MNPASHLNRTGGGTEYLPTLLMVGLGKASGDAVSQAIKVLDKDVDHRTLLAPELDNMSVETLLRACEASAYTVTIVVIDASPKATKVATAVAKATHHAGSIVVCIVQHRIARQAADRHAKVGRFDVTLHVPARSAVDAINAVRACVFDGLRGNALVAWDHETAQDLLCGSDGTAAVGWSAGLPLTSAEALVDSAIGHQLLGRARMRRAESVLLSIHVNGRTASLTSAQQIASAVWHQTSDSAHFAFTVNHTSDGAPRVDVSLLVTPGS